MSIVFIAREEDVQRDSICAVMDESPDVVMDSAVQIKINILDLSCTFKEHIVVGEADCLSIHSGVKGFSIVID